MNLLEGIKLTKQNINQAMNMEGLTFGFETEFYFTGNVNQIYTRYMMKSLETPKSPTEDHYLLSLDKTGWHDVIRYFTPASSSDWGLEDNTELLVNRLRELYVNTYGEEEGTLSDMWNDLMYSYDPIELMIDMKMYPEKGFAEIDETANDGLRKVAGSGQNEYAPRLSHMNTGKYRTILVDDEDYEFKVSPMEERNTEILFDLLSQVWGAYLGEPVGYTIANDKKKMKDASRDYTNWALTVDPSLNSQDAKRSMVSFELISPIMTGVNGYKSLEKVLRALQDPSILGLKGVKTVTDESTGLHLNIGFANREIDYLKVLVLMGDEHILDQFGRLGNSYTKSSNQGLKQGVSDEANLPTLVREIEGEMKIDASDMQRTIEELKKLVPMKGRNYSVNLEKLPAGYIEFRSLGNVDYHLMSDEILGVARNLMVMIMIATEPSAYRQEYYKAIFKILNNAIVRVQTQKDMESNI